MNALFLYLRSQKVLYCNHDSFFSLPAGKNVLYLMEMPGKKILPVTQRVLQNIKGGKIYAVKRISPLPRRISEN